MTTANSHHNQPAQSAPLILESDGSFEATSAEVASIFHTAARYQEKHPGLTDDEAFEAARASLVWLMETGQVKRYDDGESIFYLHVPSQILTNMTEKFSETGAYIEARLEVRELEEKILAAEQSIEKSLRNAQDAVTSAFTDINGLLSETDR